MTKGNYTVKLTQLEKMIKQWGKTYPYTSRKGNKNEIINDTNFNPLFSSVPYSSQDIIEYINDTIYSILLSNKIKNEYYNC